MNVLLLGFRGSGKTTIGRALASRLRRAFLDLDDITLSRLGERSVTEAWRRHGEAAWRAVEEQALADALQFDDHIIALGGGTAAIPEAMRAIRAEQRAGRARTVYLKCSAETLTARLRADQGDRPSLTGQGTTDEVEVVLKEREPVYRQLADITINAEAAPEAIAAALAEKLARPEGLSNNAVNAGKND